MARTVEDAALLWSVMSGEPGRASVSRGSLSGWRVAWAPAFAGTLPVEPAVATALEPASVVIEGLGCVLVDRYPDLDGARETFFTLRARSFAEELGYLLPEHRDEIKATVVWNIEQGFNVSEGDVARAVDRMRAIREASESFFDDVDVLVQPVTQVVPFDADLEYPTNVAGAPMDTYLDWMASCWTISVLGGPAISVPFGFTGEGLPVGIQIVGRRGDDRRVLQFAWAFEAATLAGERRPVASDVGEPRREIP